MNALRIRRKFELSALSALKVWITLGFFTLLLLLGGQALGDRYGLLVGFILGLSLNSLVFLFADMRLAGLFQAQELEGRDPWGALQMTSELAAQAEVPTPAVHLISVPTPISYSAGLLVSRSHIFLSEELTRRLSPEELRAVIALEIARLKLHLTCAGTAAAALAGLVSLIAVLIDSTVFLQLMRKRRPGQIRPMALVVSPLVALLVRGAIGRSAWMESDRLASTWLKSPELVARVIWKLDSYSKTLPLDVILSEAHLFAVNPLSRCRWCRFAFVQPSAKTRIQSLTGRFPL